MVLFEMAINTRISIIILFTQDHYFSGCLFHHWSSADEVSVPCFWQRRRSQQDILDPAPTPHQGKTVLQFISTSILPKVIARIWDPPLYK